MISGDEWQLSTPVTQFLISAIKMNWIFKDNHQWNRSRSRNKKAMHNLLSCYITPKDGFRSYIYKMLTRNPCKMTLTLVSRMSGFKRNSLLYWTVERLVNCKSAAWLDLKIPHLWEPIEAVGLNSFTPATKCILKTLGLHCYSLS